MLLMFFLYIEPKFENALRNKRRVTSDKKQLHNVELVDPAFKLPDKVDTLMGTGVPEDNSLGKKGQWLSASRMYCWKSFFQPRFRQ